MRKRYHGSYRNRKRLRWSVITWCILGVCLAVFLYQVYRFPLLPGKWKLLGSGILILIGLLCGAVSFHKARNSGKIGITVINSLLASALLVASVLLPDTASDIRKIFKDVPETVTMQINIYALKTEYKSQHSDLFKQRGVITSVNLADYKNKQFITQNSVDQENQEHMVQELNSMFSVDHIWENRKETIWDALEAFYNAEGDALILNAAYVDTVVETDLYAGFRDDTVLLQTFTKEVPVEEPVNETVLTDTFSVFIAGSDSRDARLTTVTRTDVDIVATVNPDKKQIMLVSFPRDSYIPNPALGGANDKLTHMGVYGINNSVVSLSNLLTTQINNYVLVNFDTFTKVINTLGGITVANPYAFTSSTYSFPEGEITLNGESALYYVRERHNLADGDFGRNRHQIIVLQALLRKLLTTESIANYQSILESLQGTFLTNINIDRLFELVADQMDSAGSWQIITYHLGGTGGSDICASMPGMYLYVVYPDAAQIQFVSQQMNKMYKGEDVVQETMP